jgi:uncharacterized membrane protein
MLFSNHYFTSCSPMSEFAILLGIVLLIVVARMYARLSEAEALIKDLLVRLQIMEARERAPQPRNVPQESGADIPATPKSRAEVPIAPQPAAPPVIPPPLPTFVQQPSRLAGMGAAPPPRQPPPPVAPPSPVEPKGNLPGFNLEAFMGRKLFNWLGGFIAFLAIAFSIKWSFEHNLVTPLMRVTIGGLVGLGLVVGGWFVPKEKYAITGQTLCATGVVTLYAVVFGAHALYGYFGLSTAFALMAGITAGAFLLSMQMKAQVITILGLLGGFLTPFLLSTEQDHPLALFSYIALLDAGLVAVALSQRWRHLVTLAAVATALMQWAWFATFFHSEKVFTAGWIFLGFELLFILPFWLSNREDLGDNWTTAASSLMGASALGFCAALLTYNDLGHKPWIVLSFALLADGGLVALPIRRTALQLVPVAGGFLVFVLLGAWNSAYLDRALLPWALGYFVAFAAFHTATPIILRRLRPAAQASHWAQIFPALSLVLMLWPAVRIGSSTLLWSAVLLADLAAIALAAYTASILGIVAALVLTLAAAGFWLVEMPAETPDLLGLLIVIGGFAALFCGASAFLQRRFSSRDITGAAQAYERDALRFLPAISAILPFLLLVSVFTRLNLLNPSPVFGVGLLLIVMLLALARWSGNQALPLVGLGCGLLLQFAWFEGRSTTDIGLAALAWPLVFAGSFAVFPFCFQSRKSPSLMPWATAAVAAPLHYAFIVHAVEALWPAFWKAAAGLVPAALALPLIAAMEYLRRNFPRDNPARPAVLAWYGGAVLSFVTLIFPAQFHREWLTISWALEGAALLWLWHRIPHQGLKITGFALLCVAFVRLTLNFDVFSYHARSGAPILNWYLYTFGIPAAALFLGGQLVKPPLHRPATAGSINICATLHTLATILCFILLNVEIADFFATGPALTFDFTGSLAQDMTYSIAWSLFALVMLIIGMMRKIAAIRYAGIALLVVTLLKLFLHDLANLDQLYRIAALFGVSLVVFGAAYLYQRFLGAEKKPEESPP